MLKILTNREAVLAASGFVIGSVYGAGLALAHKRKFDDKITEYGDLAHTILDESCKFLMERADDKTLHDLNNHLDYWRVVVGQVTEGDAK